MFLRFSACYSLVNVPGVRTPWLLASYLARTHPVPTRRRWLLVIGAQFSVFSFQCSVFSTQSSLLSAPSVLKLTTDH